MVRLRRTQRAARSTVAPTSRAEFACTKRRADHEVQPLDPEDHMSELGNKAEQVKGKLKEAAGDVTDDDSLRNEGKADHASGKAKEKVGDLKDKAEQTIESVKDTVTRDR
jgi:uncharacterized protein YjbJ (UPF0337 family)